MKSLSRVRLLATPWTAAYQAPLPMGFSRQEYWSGVQLPSPLTSLLGQNLMYFSGQKLGICSKGPYAYSCLFASDICLSISPSMISSYLHYPMDCSLPGSSAHGIFQARVLEWGAIAFSDLKHKLTFLIDMELSLLEA